MKRPENKFGDETRQKNFLSPPKKIFLVRPHTKKIKKSENLMKRPETKFGREIRKKFFVPPPPHANSVFFNTE